MEQERRSSPRVSTTIEIIFKEPKSFIRAYMLNVSNGGLFIKTEDPLPLDSFVVLKVKIPTDPGDMEIKGRVVWTNPRGRKNSFLKGMGIQFVSLKPADKEKIDAFVEKHFEEIKADSLI